jgi:hypothetical protein
VTSENARRAELRWKLRGVFFILCGSGDRAQEVRADFPKRSAPSRGIVRVSAVGEQPGQSVVHHGSGERECEGADLSDARNLRPDCANLDGSRSTRSLAPARNSDSRARTLPSGG